MLTLLPQPQDIFGSNRLHVRKVTRCLEGKKAAGVSVLMCSLFFSHDACYYYL